MDMGRLTLLELAIINIDHAKLLELTKDSAWGIVAVIRIKSVPSTIVSSNTFPLLFDKIACNGPRPARDECSVRRRWLSTSRAGLVL